MSDNDLSSQEPIRLDVAKIEARILRRVAEALRAGYTPGYYGHGGPQDGDDEPPSFDVKKAATYLELEADTLEEKA